MDQESKDLLKRDLFVLGLLIKWQEKAAIDLEIVCITLGLLKSRRDS